MIPRNTPNRNGIIIFILVNITDIEAILPMEDNIILYVPSIIRRAEEDTPGTTVPMASRRPEINSIIISKIFPFNI